jgi:hypothetical protein
MHVDLIVAERQRLVHIVKMIDRRRRIGAKAKQRSLLGSGIIQNLVVAMEIDWSAQDFLRAAHSRNMIDVRVRQEDVLHQEALAGDDVEQRVDFVSWIDDHRLARTLATGNEAVLVKGLDEAGL